MTNYHENSKNLGCCRIGDWQFHQREKRCSSKRQEELKFDVLREKMVDFVFDFRIGFSYFDFGLGRFV